MQYPGTGSTYSSTAIGQHRCHAMSGTDVLYGATRMAVALNFSRAMDKVSSAICLRVRYAMPGTHIAFKTAAICLRARSTLPGTDMAYGATAICLRARYALPGRMDGWQNEVDPPMLLRAREAVSGTERAYGATRALCDARYRHSVRYAMTGIDAAYGTTCVLCGVQYWNSVWFSLVGTMPGIDGVYAATIIRIR
eukprot:3927686-Rhodomonas_salina.4